MNLADMVSMTSVQNAGMNQTCQYNTKTFETLNSQDSLLGGMSGGAFAASFTSNLSKRVADAMKKHSSLQFKWLKQIERINQMRA